MAATRRCHSGRKKLQAGDHTDLPRGAEPNTLGRTEYPAEWWVLAGADITSGITPDTINLITKSLLYLLLPLFLYYRIVTSNPIGNLQRHATVPYR